MTLQIQYKEHNCFNFKQSVSIIIIITIALFYEAICVTYHFFFKYIKRIVTDSNDSLENVNFLHS